MNLRGHLKGIRTPLSFTQSPAINSYTFTVFFERSVLPGLSPDATLASLQSAGGPLGREAQPAETNSGSLAGEEHETGVKLCLGQRRSCFSNRSCNRLGCGVSPSLERQTRRCRCPVSVPAALLQGRPSWSLKKSNTPHNLHSATCKTISRKLNASVKTYT